MFFILLAIIIINSKILPGGIYIEDEIYDDIEYINKLSKTFKNSFLKVLYNNNDDQEDLYKIAFNLCLLFSEEDKCTLFGKRRLYPIFLETLKESDTKYRQQFFELREMIYNNL